MSTGRWASPRSSAPNRLLPRGELGSKVSKVPVVRVALGYMIFGHRDRTAPSVGDGGSPLCEEPRRGHRRRTNVIGLAADEQTQSCHQIFQGFRLCIEFFRSAGALLGAGGIALGDLIQLG